MACQCHVICANPFQSLRPLSLGLVVTWKKTMIPRELRERVFSVRCKQPLGWRSSAESSSKTTPSSSKAHYRAEDQGSTIPVAVIVYSFKNRQVDPSKSDRWVVSCLEPRTLARDS